MGYKVFISFKRNALDGSGKTRDYELAEDLHRMLKVKGIETFFSKKDLSTADFRDEIDEALDEAQILVAVGTSREHLESRNVKYEWHAFYEDVLNGYKTNGQIYTYLEGMEQKQLPLALRQKQSFLSDQKELLVQFIMENLGIKDSLSNEQTTQTVTPKPAPQPVRQTQSAKPTPPPTPQLNVQVGGKVPFGQYPQGSNGEVQPLVWRVLAVENGKALLITDKLIDYVKYNESFTNVTWETCTLRKWMNNDFISKAFGSSQQVQIATVTNQNPDNPKYRTNGGNATQDKIFALSIDEAKKYFSSDFDRKACTTDYAHKRGYDSEDCSEYWWLRSPGLDSLGAADVGLNGRIDQNDNFVNSFSVAVRPAFWLNL